MSVNERKFNTFILGDDPQQLADNALGRVAGACSRPLDGTPERYDELIDFLAPRIVDGEIRENSYSGGGLPVNKTANDVESSGIEGSFDRSLWTPEIACPPDAPRIAMGGPAYWQDFVVKECMDEYDIQRQRQGQLWIAVGNRRMNTRVEAERNKNVIEYHDNFGEYPTEKQYAETYVAPAARDSGYTDVRVEGYDAEDEQEVAKNFVAAHGEELFAEDKRVVFAAVSHAVVHIAQRYRTLARATNPHFDTDPNNPQVYLCGRGKFLARSNYALNQPEKYQSPYDSLYHMVRTAKALEEARLELQQ